MLPYYAGFERRIMEKKLGRALNRTEKEESREKAITRCKAIIEVEFGKNVSKPVVEEIDRFDLI